MITYHWTIANLERNASDGGVIVAHWRVSAHGDGFSKAAYGTVNFTPVATAPDFVPYEQLTEADVLSWVWGQSDGWRERVEAALAGQIANAKAPKTQYGTPWN